MRREELLEVMPHRCRNVLIDDYEDTSGTSGRGTLRIAEDDPHGREIFLVRGPEGLRYSHFFLVEHAALNSVMILRTDMGGGRLAYFSTISRFAARSFPPAGTEIVSHVSRGRDRGEFRSFSAELRTADGEPVLDVGFMAYLTARGTRPDEGRAAPAASSAAAGFPPPDPAAFPCLAPRMSFLADAEDGRRGGVYPADHPLCEGHFPGAPVMMGMSQWLAVAQHAALDAPEGESEVAGGGGLATADGRAVVDVAGLRIGVRKESGRVVDLRLLATKRVAFRDRILPGDAYVSTFSVA